MKYHRSPECLRAQAIKDLRAQELQAIRETCAAAARMIVTQNLKDLATRK